MNPLHLFHLLKLIRLIDDAIDPPEPWEFFRRATPPADIPSRAPRTSGRFFFVSGLLCLLAGAGVVFTATPPGPGPIRTGVAIGFGALAAILLLLALATRLAIFRHRRAFYDVLAGALDHRPGKAYSAIVSTAFCYPPSVPINEPTSVFLFAQNSSNRPRQLEVHLTPEPDLLLAPSVYRLQLMPFEAACLRVPFQLGPSLRVAGPEPASLTVSIKRIHRNEGPGIQLIREVFASKRGVGPEFAVPLTLDVARHRPEIEFGVRELILAPPEWISLWHPRQTHPTHETIRGILGSTPYQSIQRFSSSAPAPRVRRFSASDRLDGTTSL